MKIRVSVSTDMVGSKSEKAIEIPDTELEDLDDFHRNEYITDSAREAMFDMIEWDWEEVL